MFSILLSTLLPLMTRADEVCIYISVQARDHYHTTDQVCAYQYGSDGSKVEACRWGIGHSNGRSEISNNLYDKSCIDFHDGTLVDGRDLYITTNGLDALWIDRIHVSGTGVGGKSFERFWGNHNHWGWCLSIDRNDYLDWNHAGHVWVPEKDCFHTMKFVTEGSDRYQTAVYGWKNFFQERYCRHHTKMDCKQDCQPGWSHFGTSDHGCCTPGLSCGGNMKKCRIDVPCKRPSYSFMFNGCPRGEGARNWYYAGHYNRGVCQELCDKDPRCNYIEVNGCNADAGVCGGACWLFTGAIGGDVYNGNCVTNGDQQTYKKQRRVRRLDEDAGAAELPESWTTEDGVTITPLPTKDGEWVKLTTTTEEALLLERLRKQEAGISDPTGPPTNPPTDTPTNSPTNPPSNPPTNPPTELPTELINFKGATTEDVVEGTTTRDVVEGATTEADVEETNLRRLE